MKHNKTAFEQKIFDSLTHNSFLFLKETLGRLMNQDANVYNAIDNDLLTLTCADLQISLELAVRAVVFDHLGIEGVLKKGQKELTEQEIIKRYKDKTLKVEEFEKLKNYLKTNKKKLKLSLSNSDFKEIERFQLYRNRIVHFSCDFTGKELVTLRDDILYYIVHVVLVLLTDATTGETPAELLQSQLGFDFYKQIKEYKPYVMAMERYASKNSSLVWFCIGCMHRTYSPIDDLCYCCGYETLTGYNRVDCGSCGTKKSVIYDDLDIHNEGNNHTMRGRCLDCGEDTYVFECPECGEAHDISLNLGRKYCQIGHCINKTLKDN